MLKGLGLVYLLAVGFAAALPASPRSPTSEPDDCSKECINGVIKYGQELSILKHSDLSNYFNKIDETCEVIKTAQKCLEACGTATSNPFALESLNIVCQPETQAKIESIKQCLHYIDSSVNEICAKECNSEHIIDETDVTKENPMIQKANGDCAAFKCAARCNVEVVSQQCGKDLGKEFQGLLQQVMDVQRKDLENLKLVEMMAKTSPPECNYLYDPSVLFGSSKVEEETPATPESHDPKEDVKTLYAQAQLQLLLKQLELTEKQDQLIDRENAKLDMEMSYMAHKAEQREQRFHAQQHSIPTFVPMEKMPKEHPPMPMEATEPGHPEQMPSAEAHPPVEEDHAQQPSEEQPHPEQMPMEPSHPPPMPMEAHPPMPMEESNPQPMPAMDPHQPMESHPPMDFPHPEAMHVVQMPMEMIPEEAQHPPRQQKMSRHSMPPPPMILEGVPMEFVPMEGIPIELPMHLPMQAAEMPRFL